ncbi:MAG: hydrogenase [Gammaproteobacteria bacterium CG22_combo_CG10-13_8_21_14_all_40_8]|nr:MAG: hydrogenase [Gammaproteobacteria bacterium CG22_combo_CG10-13_8_21_14_all_40_8]
MFKVLKKIISIGIVTETLEIDKNVELLGNKLKQQVNKRFARSLAIRAVDSGSCNGCELELHAINNAFYDAERYGIHFVASPRHADILLVTGCVSRHMEEAVFKAYTAMPHPKWVIALGNCAIDGGIFGSSYASLGGLQKLIQVDYQIAGCAPTPLNILQGLLGFMEHLSE